MSSVKAVEEAFKQAVDRALCRVSRRAFRSEITAERDQAAAMKELAKLKNNGAATELSAIVTWHCSTTQQYLPRQINATYSESVQVF